MKLKKFDPNRIPDGPYCYRFTGRTKKSIVKGFGKNPIEYPETKNCPYYKHVEDIEGLCLVLDLEIEDQCKICKYNWDEDEEYEKWYQKNKEDLSCGGTTP